MIITLKWNFVYDLRVHIIIYGDYFSLSNRYTLLCCKQRAAINMKTDKNAVEIQNKKYKEIVFK